MIRYYNFEWYSKKDKYGPKITRHTNITLSNPTGEIKEDCKAAMEIFTKSVGNLNKIEVVKIKEFDENGQIGEDIIPTDNQIAPLGERKKV